MQQPQTAINWQTDKVWLTSRNTNKKSTLYAPTLALVESRKSTRSRRRRKWSTKYGNIIKFKCYGKLLLTTHTHSNTYFLVVQVYRGVMGLSKSAPRWCEVLKRRQIIEKRENIREERDEEKKHWDLIQQTMYTNIHIWYVIKHKHVASNHQLSNKSVQRTPSECELLNWVWDLE